MVTTVKGKFPHVEWMDIGSNNVLVEVAVLRRDELGNVYFFRLDALDDIDRTRLVKILMNRNANAFELWDLMSQITLGNGMNALEYFHQLVKVITPTGQILKPSKGQRGIALSVDASSPERKVVPEEDDTPKKSKK